MPGFEVLNLDSAPNNERQFAYKCVVIFHEALFRDLKSRAAPVVNTLTLEFCHLFEKSSLRYGIH
jgi:hypothetical protein